jgi:hypothetical protein
MLSDSGLGTIKVTKEVKLSLYPGSIRQNGLGAVAFTSRVAYYPCYVELKARLSPSIIYKGKRKNEYVCIKKNI